MKILTAQFSSGCLFLLSSKYVPQHLFLNAKQVYLNIKIVTSCGHKICMENMNLEAHSCTCEKEVRNWQVYGTGKV
jgi:hypothetical protein